jgi:hypothetical protein
LAVTPLGAFGNLGLPAGLFAFVGLTPDARKPTDWR